MKWVSRPANLMLTDDEIQALLDAAVEDGDHQVRLALLDEAVERLAASCASPLTAWLIAALRAARDAFEEGGEAPAKALVHFGRRKRGRPTHGSAPVDHRSIAELLKAADFDDASARRRLLALSIDEVDASSVHHGLMQWLSSALRQLLAGLVDGNDAALQALELIGRRSGAGAPRAEPLDEVAVAAAVSLLAETEGSRAKAIELVAFALWKQTPGRRREDSNDYYVRRAIESVVFDGDASCRFGLAEPILKVVRGDRYPPHRRSPKTRELLLKVPK